MTRRLVQVGTVLLLAGATGCASLKEGLGKAVLMDYDQVNNFRSYDFAGSFAIDWGGGTAETGIYGHSTHTNPTTNGFWATFVICNLRNEGSKAGAFPYDAGRFYVEYDGKKHFYKPLDAYTYTSLPNGLPGNNSVTALVNDRFRLETQLGPNADTFQKGYYPTVGYRVAIYVTKSSPGQVDTSELLPLRYDGYPNITSPRNQPPVVLNPGQAASLGTTCRPKFQ